MMTLSKRLFSSSVAAVLTAFGSQAAYLCCYFNDALARHCMLPLLYVAFWPNCLLNFLFDPGRQSGPEGGSLRSACLTSVTGWLVLAIAVALVRHYMTLQREHDFQHSPSAVTHGG